MIMNKNFFRTKNNMSKKSFKTSWFFKKKRKKIFFRKLGPPVKPEYPVNRESSQTFPDSLLKFNSLQVFVKKNQLF